MGFWEVFVAECNRVGKKPNPVAKELGISSGAVTRWKNGSVPSGDALVKIADFFGVSVGHLLGANEKKPTPATGERDERRVRLEEDFSRLSPERQAIVIALIEEWKREG